LTITVVNLVAKFYAVAKILQIYCWGILIWSTLYIDAIGLEVITQKGCAPEKFPFCVHPQLRLLCPNFADRHCRKFATRKSITNTRDTVWYLHYVIKSWSQYQSSSLLTLYLTLWDLTR